MPDPARRPPTRVPLDGRQLVAFEDLVGRQEIAEQLGVTVAAVDTWRRRYPTFPEPLVILSATPIWRWSAVSSWARSTPRRPGRPPKGASATVAGAVALFAVLSELLEGLS
jgi:hypothetical protein